MSKAWDELDRFAGAPPPEIPLSEVEDFDVPKTEAVEPESPYVVRQTLWSQRKGRLLAAELPNEQERDSMLLADFFSASFEPNVELEENPKDKTLREWLERLMQTPEFAKCRATTSLNIGMSDLMAMSLRQSFLAYEQEEEQRSNEKPDQRDPDDKENAEQSIRMSVSVASATKKVAEELEVLCSIAGLLAGNGAQVSPDELKQAYKKFVSSARIKQIMLAFGRFWRICQSLQRSRVDAQSSEIVSIVHSGEIERLLPWELVQIAGVIPQLKPLALYRLACSRCLSYSRSDRAKEIAGPIIVSVDESESMTGSRYYMAKGLALAIMRMACAQRRSVMLVSFSWHSSDLKEGAQSSPHIIVPAGEEPNKDELYNYMCSFLCGGTSAISALIYPKVLWPYKDKRADHIIITDGDLELIDDVLPDYEEWCKEQNITTYGLGICLDERGMDKLRKCCDRVWNIQELAVDSEPVLELLTL